MFKGIKSWFLSEFKCSNWDLNHSTPTLFAQPQWPIPQVAFIIYRGIWSLWFVIWIVLCGIDWVGLIPSMRTYPDDIYNSPTVGPKWFIYLTHWAFTLVTTNCIIQTSIVLEFYLRSKRLSSEDPVYPEMPLGYKLAWVIYNMSTCSPFIISGLYWGFVHEVDKYWVITGVNFHTHAVQSIFTLVDLCIIHREIFVTSTGCQISKTSIGCPLDIHWMSDWWMSSGGPPI